MVLCLAVLFGPKQSYTSGNSEGCCRPGHGCATVVGACSYVVVCGGPVRRILRDGNLPWRIRKQLQWMRVGTLLRT